MAGEVVRRRALGSDRQGRTHPVPPTAAYRQTRPPPLGPPVPHHLRSGLPSASRGDPVRRAAAHRLLSAQYGKVHGGQSPDRPEAVSELRPRIPRRRRQHRCQDQPCFEVFGRACRHTDPGRPATTPPARKHTCSADSASSLRCARASQTSGACRAQPSRRRCPRTCSPQGSGRRPDAASRRPGRAERRIRCRRHPLPARCPSGQARAPC